MSRAPQDPDKAASYARCLADSPHVKTLLGLMEQDGVRFVPIEGTTNWGVPWLAIFVQGQDVAAMRQVAERLRDLLDGEAGRIRRDTGRS